MLDIVKGIKGEPPGKGEEERAKTSGVGVLLKGAGTDYGSRQSG